MTHINSSGAYNTNNVLIFKEKYLGMIGNKDVYFIRGAVFSKCPNE